MSWRPVSFGITVIELIVSLAVVAILLALVLAGIQFAREASRRMSCSSNLHQIGLAMANYEALHRVLPSGMCGGLSWHVAILPYSNSEALETEIVNRFRTQGLSGLNINKRPSWYACASDDGGRFVEGASGGLPTHYAGNVGTWLPLSGFNGAFQSCYSEFDGYPAGPVHLSLFERGTSATIGVSEILPGNGSWDRLRVNWFTASSYSTVTPPDLNGFVNECNSLPASPFSLGWKGDPACKGMPWTRGDFAITLYNHALPPNSPSCYDWHWVQTGIVAAGSRHSSGANALYVDGHVKFIPATIELSVWRLAGARSGSVEF